MDEANARGVDATGGQGTPPPVDVYVTFDDALALSGLTKARLRGLIRQGSVRARRGGDGPFLPLSDVRRVAALREGDEPIWLPASSTLPLLPAQVPGTNGSVHQDGAAIPAPAEQLFSFNRVVAGHALDVIRSMPKACVQAVVTSPPYCGQRVYQDERPTGWTGGDAVAFGREKTPEAYVRHTLEILQALAPVLKEGGTVWWNIADSYMTRTIMHASSAERIRHYGGERSRWAENPNRRTSHGHPYLKDKDLSLVPFMIAMGAQRLGYWVRSVIVWSKQKPPEDHGAGGGQAHNGMVTSDARTHMPEVVVDRPVTGHEYVLLLTRDERYKYRTLAEADGAEADRTGVNVRTVWNFRPVGVGGKHGARFPVELPRRCILLGSDPGDLIFDPFAGEGTTLRVAAELGRAYFGCDISPTYVALAREQLAHVQVALASSVAPAPAGAGAPNTA